MTKHLTVGQQLRAAFVRGEIVDPVAFAARYQFSTQGVHKELKAMSHLITVIQRGNRARPGQYACNDLVGLAAYAPPSRQYSSRKANAKHLLDRAPNVFTPLLMAWGLLTSPIDIDCPKRRHTMPMDAPDEALA